MCWSQNAGNISHFCTVYHPHPQFSIIIFSYIKDRHMQFTFIQSHRQTEKSLHVIVRISVYINLLVLLLLFLHYLLFYYTELIQNITDIISVIFYLQRQLKYFQIMSLMFCIPSQNYEVQQNLLPNYRFYILILIYLLTAIGLTPSSSSTVHIYTQTIHRTTQTQNNTIKCQNCWM
jgi:hypothetical protein